MKELSNVAKELEKSVAIDTTQIHLKKMLRKEQTVKELYKRNFFPFYSLQQNVWDLHFPLSSPCHQSSLVLTKTHLSNLLLL